MGEWMEPRLDEMLIYPTAQLPPNFLFTLSFFTSSPFLGNGTLFLLTFPLTQ